MSKFSNCCRRIASTLTLAGACSILVPTSALAGVEPIGKLNGIPYYEDDCNLGDPISTAIVVSGIKLCPDERVLRAVYPTYPTAPPTSGHGFDPDTFDDYMADTLGDKVVGLSWIVVDTHATPDEMVLTSGGTGWAWHPYDGDALAPFNSFKPEGIWPMLPHTYSLTGSVSKFVTSVLFLRELEEIADDPVRNPAGLTVPQLLELPAWHFLPQSWKACIGDAGCGVTLDEGEDVNTANESFKEVRIGELISHKSGLGKSGTDMGSQTMQRYLVTGRSKYTLGDNPPGNAQPGVYDYENVNIEFMGPLTLGLSRPKTRLALGQTFEGFPFFGSPGLLETWSALAREFAIGEMQDVFGDILELTGTDFRYSCNAPAWQDTLGGDIDSIAPVYDEEAMASIGGLWFSSQEVQNGCSPQGSYWISPDSMADLVYDLDNGFFEDDQIMPMIRANENSSMRMIFGPPLKDSYMDVNFGHNNGDILYKGGDQGANSEWYFASSLIPAGDQDAGAHSAVVYLPSGHVAFVVTNSNGTWSKELAETLKDAWKWAVHADTPALPMP